MTRDIVILGSGNVATHLAKGYANAGFHVSQVYSRSAAHAARLADSLPDCSPIDDLAQVKRDASLYLIAVSDAAVGHVADSLPAVDGVLAHTSGTVPLQRIAVPGRASAVIYPLQTFTREAPVDLSSVPFFTEASDDGVQTLADSFASALSTKVYHADSDKRRTLHVAGVLSCNFVNYLWDCTARVLAADSYDFTVVEPLVRATLEKAVAIGPHAAQTGPAMRCDTAVMRAHIERLDPVTADLYKRLSQAIIDSHNLDCKL